LAHYRSPDAAALIGSFGEDGDPWFDETSFGPKDIIGLPQDKQFIAAANPAAVLELIERLERAESEAQTAHNLYSQEMDRLRPAVHYVQKRADALGLMPGQRITTFIGAHFALIAERLERAEVAATESSKDTHDAERWRAIRALPMAGIYELWMHSDSLETLNRNADIASEEIQRMRTRSVDAAIAAMQAEKR
jgi:hypothetical protein